MASSDSFLIHLTAALVKSRKLFLVTFLLVLVSGVVYQVAPAPQYQHVTVVELAQNGEGALLEAVDGVMASVENQWIPRVMSQFREEYGHVPGFAINISDVEGGVILFSSVGEVELSDEIRWLHSALGQKLVESQAVLEKLARTKLEQQIDVAERGLQAFQKNNTPGLSDTGLFEALVSLKGRLIGMQPAEIRVVAQQKEEALGLGLGLRLALTVIQAFVLAVFVVLFYYFIRRVNRVIQYDKERS